MTRRRNGLRARLVAMVMLIVLCVTATTAFVAYTTRLSHYAHIRHFALGLVFAGTLAAGAVSYVMARVVIDALRQIATVAHDFGEGNLDARAPVDGPGELAEVGRSFNAMADRLSDTLRDLHESQTLQHRFVSDVSHELRTPLATILAAHEGLDSADLHTRGRSVELVRDQSRRLAKLVDDLLEMSRFDAGQAAIDREPVDLVELAADVAHTVAPGEDVRITSLGQTVADVDARRIHTVLRNLVTNAMQHGAPPIDIVVDGRDPGLATVTVADDGPGVPSHLTAAIFDRFVRVDTARTSQGGNSGLGLAIALENARLHGATLTLSTSGRTAFALGLPRGRPPDGVHASLKIKKQD